MYSNTSQTSPPLATLLLNTYFCPLLALRTQLELSYPISPHANEEHANGVIVGIDLYIAGVH